MKVNLEQVLLNPKGEPYQDNATLGMAAYSAMGAQLPTDGQVPIDKKLSMFRISQKLAAGGEQELTAEDIAIIKERAGAALGVFPYGSIVAALENAATVKAIGKDEAKEAKA